MVEIDNCNKYPGFLNPITYLIDFIKFKFVCLNLNCCHLSLRLGNLQEKDVVFYYMYWLLKTFSVAFV